MDLINLIIKYRSNYHFSETLLNKTWNQLKDKNNIIIIYAEDENILDILMPLLNLMDIKVSFLTTGNYKLFYTQSKYSLIWKPMKEVYSSEENYYWIPGFWWNTDSNKIATNYSVNNEIPINLFSDIFIRFLFHEYGNYFDYCTDKQIFSFFSSRLPQYKNSKISEGNCLGKCAIYTCIVGDYDEFHEPVYISDNCDYYLISDKEPKNLDCVKWIDIREVVPKDITDKVEISRWPKMHPHYIFKNYEYSIYMDGCYCCIGDVRKLLLFGKTGISIYHHPYRKCIYTEALVLAACKKGKAEEIKKQISRYHEEGMPVGFGLYENCVIVRQHNKKTCIELMEAWWKEYHTESKRDQLSLPYVVWKNGYNFNDIGILGNDVLDCKLLYKYNHCNEDSSENRCWLFPYDMIQKGSRVVLYGAGEVGKDFYYQAEASVYCKVVLWIDRRFEQYQQMQMPVYPPNKVQQIRFDYVIICNAVKAVAEDMKRYLMTLGVSEEKIVSPNMIHKKNLLKEMLREKSNEQF